MTTLIVPQVSTTRVEDCYKNSGMFYCKRIAETDTDGQARVVFVESLGGS